MFCLKNQKLSLSLAHTSATDYSKCLPPGSMFDNKINVKLAVKKLFSLQSARFLAVTFLFSPHSPDFLQKRKSHLVHLTNFTNFLVHWAMSH